MTADLVRGYKAKEIEAKMLRKGEKMSFLRASRSGFIRSGEDLFEAGDLRLEVLTSNKQSRMADMVLSSKLSKTQIQVNVRSWVLYNHESL